MISSFRRISKSKIGTIIMALFFVTILASFALADVSNVTALGGGSGLSSDELASAGSFDVTDRDMSRAMERRLAEVRQQNPEAGYSSLAGDFDRVLAALINDRALQAFADEHGFNLSKRLIDAEIATLPGARGLDGRFSEQAYASFLAQQRVTDDEVRAIIRNSMLQQLLIAPPAVNARVPVGLARPYASMLLETREGAVAFVPVAAFRTGLNPTDAQVQQFYSANREQYVVPEQRVLRFAKIGPEQVAGVSAADQEIAAYYQANAATYAPKEVRVISQAVVPAQATAQAIAQRARGDGSFAEAAAPAGLSAADVSVGPQTQAQFTELAGAEVAAAAFRAQEGAIIGPIRSDLGWHVVKIDDVRQEGGQPLSAVRGEIATQLTAEKRKNALADLVTAVEDAIAEGASFTEATSQAKLQVSETPLITANGTSRTESSYRFPQELAPALKTGFEMTEGDEPFVETLPNEGGYVVVAPTRIVPAAPAPLAEIRDRVRADWINQKATERARNVASAIAQRAAKAPLQAAVKAAPVPLPAPEPIKARRLELAQFEGRVPPALGLLFSMGKGHVRAIPNQQAGGFFVVKVDEITPGNALNAPSLITQTQQQLQQSLSEEYALQFLNAIRQDVGIRRNDKAIAATKSRIVAGN